MVKPDTTALSCYFLVGIADDGHKMGFKTRMVQILQKTIESESVSRGQVDRAQNEKDGSDFEEDGTRYPALLMLILPTGTIR